MEKQELLAALESYGQRYQKEQKLLQLIIKRIKRLVSLLADPIGEAFTIEKETEAFIAVLNETGVHKDLIAVLSELKPMVASWKQEKTLAFGRGLIDEFKAAGYELTHRGSEFHIQGFIIQPDFTVGSATIEYAREVAKSKVPLKLKAIVKAFEACRKELTGRKTEPLEFLKQLYEAYRRVLFMQGAVSGTRVNVIDVMSEVAFLMQKDTFRKDPRRELFRSYSRAQFSYDLNELRQKNTLQISGLRLNIGTATIDYTDQKRKSLYLTDGRGGGNYIMYISFIQMGVMQDVNTP